jgi:hypothetical protein
MSAQNFDYHGYRLPPEIISYAVWLYHRFSLSFPKSCGIAKGDSVTRGTSTRSLSRFKGSVTTSGGQWTKTATYLIFVFNRTGISVRPNASFASC